MPKYLEKKNNPGRWEGRKEGINARRQDGS